MVYRPTVSMVVFLVVFQLFLARFVFRNRNFPDMTVTVDNRYIYTLPLYVLDCIHLILCRFRKKNVTMVTTMALEKDWRKAWRTVASQLLKTLPKLF